MHSIHQESDAAAEQTGLASAFLRLKNGNDAQALNNIIDVMQDDVFRWAFRATGNHEQANELRWVVFETFVHSYAKIRNPTGLRAWFRTTTWRCARTLAPHPRESATPPKEFDAIIESAFPIPDDALCAQETAKGLAKAFEELPPTLRRCIELRHLRGLTPEEIALVLGIKQKTVRENCSKAVCILRKNMHLKGIYETLSK